MSNDVIEVLCPCCQANLRVDRETGVVLSHKMPEKPPAIEDLGVAAKALKGEAARREEMFQKSFAEQKTRQSVLDKKFDELLKQAKASPDSGPPKRDIDL
ncbi:MAG TPA: hypothetical protein VER03_16275 [Bryobacteraceae bacterium]|nr:hypothetical protein [Bryobacteraceae bacterium]